MKKIILLLVMLLSCVPTFAQANKASVQKLIELSGELKEFYNITEQLSRQLSAENRDDFKKDMQPLLDKQKARLVAYYAQNLSQDEVDNLITFYQSPLAKKYVMIGQNYAVVLSNKADAFKEELQGIIMKYMM
ncbi:DUF2059 domain-containing protein [Flavobacterium sp. xlx-214]|uniref:DUF2059 domain-containing protein n=1 Tax=unclassified Flavobacterium TaxID=196869 RepID=UPI0013D660E2|nr:MULTISPECIES: DUF2059 domain-containing protein [unclassified Flavobacterium]MBA5792790.1 DUF2059 domain-containing protein [Flavobacterium sp. xlx-221]QMI83927.1 DUF2059 domain-containing protein [Flavobacterium sp. xlx-214]